MPLELNICLKTFGLKVTQLRLLNKLTSFESILSGVLCKAETTLMIPLPLIWLLLHSLSLPRCLNR